MGAFFLAGASLREDEDLKWKTRDGIHPPGSPQWQAKRPFKFPVAVDEDTLDPDASDAAISQDNPELAGETPALEGTEVPEPDEAPIQPETSEASPEASPEEEEVEADVL